MSAVDSVFTSKNIRDPLKSLFAAAEDLKITTFEQSSESEVTTNSQSEPISEKAGPDPKTSTTSAPAQPLPGAESEGDESALQAETKDISNQNADGSVKIDLSITQDKQKDDSQLSRNDLVLVLETFVNAVMDGKAAKSPTEPPHENLPSPLNFQPVQEEDPALLAMVEEKEAQINELRTLLVEAQGTIIKLLTDRVEDKAKIATLEAHARYLPDYQRTETPAPTSTAIAAPNEATGDTSEMKDDLTKVKAELEAIQLALKTSAYKNSFDKPSRWDSLKSWLASFINN